MTYQVNAADIALAYSGGSTTWMGKQVDFEVRGIGRLRITTGAVAASDPFVEPSPPAFTRPFPVGEYPVRLAIARLDSSDERVAFARVDVVDEPVDRWEPALQPGNDPATLGPDEFFGYGVDAGTGCFMDAAAGQLLDARMSDEPDYFEVVIDAMQKTYRDTWSWLVLEPLSGRPENVVMFSSGWGDGAYPSFYGLDAHGGLVALLTDFLLIESCAPADPAGGSSEPAEEGPNTGSTAPVSDLGAKQPRPWWRFWGR